MIKKPTVTARSGFRMMSFFSFASIFVLLLGVIGCGSGENKNADDGVIRVVATTGMIADAVRTIAGDHVELYAMMGPGVDPHLYKATKEDIDQLDAADAILYNGLHLEAKLGEILEKMGASRMVVAVGETIPAALRRVPPEFEGQPDPHIWFDFSLWQMVVDTIGKSLATLDTLHKTEYEVRTQELIDSLGAEHERIIGQILEIPEAHRVMVTAHDAFGYFGRAYGIEVEALQGISTVAEAGLHDVTQLVDMLVARKIKAVFVESSVSPKAIEAVVEGCRARGHEVKIGGELFSDAMGETGTPEGQILGMMRHNVSTIVEALK